MFTFESPLFLLLLLLIPWIYWRAKKASSSPLESALHPLMRAFFLPEGRSFRLSSLRPALLCLSLALVALSLADPKIKTPLKLNGHVAPVVSILLQNPNTLKDKTALFLAEEKILSLVKTHPGFRFALSFYGARAYDLIPATSDPEVFSRFLPLIRAPLLPGEDENASPRAAIEEIKSRTQSPITLVLFSESPPEDALPLSAKDTLLVYQLSPEPPSPEALAKLKSLGAQVLPLEGSLGATDATDRLLSESARKIDSALPRFHETPLWYWPLVPLVLVFLVLARAWVWLWVFFAGSLFKVARADEMKDGIEAYNEGHYSEAALHFKKVSTPYGQYNYATTLSRLSRLKEAEVVYLSLENSTDRQLRARVLHNLQWVRRARAKANPPPPPPPPPILDQPAKGDPEALALELPAPVLSHLYEEEYRAAKERP